MCLINFEKAFYTVWHEMLIDRLREIGVDAANLRALTSLYQGQKTLVGIGYDRSGLTEIRRGVRYGCVLSPDLFSLYPQAVFDELMNMEGIRIGGININDIRYVDDTALMEDTEEKLQMLVDSLNEGCERYGLKINIGQTEVMGLTKRSEQLPVNIRLRGETLNQVSFFKCLGSLVKENGRCDADIKARIGMANTAFRQLRQILVSLAINMRTRIRVFKAYVSSVLLFRCESWTISKEWKKRLEAEEMWFYRRMLRVPQTARRTNQEVLQMGGVRKEKLTKIRKRQLDFLCHVLRGNGLERDCLLGMVEGRRARGRQRTTEDQVYSWNQSSRWMQLAEDRRAWRSIEANINVDTALR